MKRPILVIALAAGLLLAPCAWADLGLRHDPPAEAPPGRALSLEFTLQDPSAWGEGAVLWRPQGSTAWQRVPILKNREGILSATLAPDAMADPGIEYCVLATDMTGTQADVFATQAAPHSVVVHDSAARLRELVSLRELGGARSELRLRGSWVDFRSFGPTAGTAADKGPRAFDAALSYRFWMFRGVEYFEAGVGSLQGEAEQVDPAADPRRAGQKVRIGFKRGWAEIGFRPGEYVGLAGRIVLGADELGFRGGVAGRLRLGKPRHTRLEFELGATGGVGDHALVAFFLETIPRVPVAFELEITNEPNNGIKYGERALVRFGFDWTRTVATHLTASYQALFGTDHGLGGGAELVVRF